ncbi:MAG: hypothetical protein LHW51_09195, partial [Candidatus Cloacimonetes bacterium]|nr:hypothetical protein [Candidatus Cloacimonadota bacterium]MCK9243581.1 hypothetical protein [Candidatus Cloacimonadota bacterium]
SHDIVTQLVQDELSYHPMLEPVDLYKLLYQALYGPFHIAGDFRQVYQAIEAELGQTSSRYLPLYQKIGPCYTRVSLAYIRPEDEPQLKQRKIADLADWLLASSEKLPDIRSHFQGQWKLYRPVLQGALTASAESWQRADQFVEEGKLPSHSEIFHQHYQPHYRLVNTSLTNHYQIFMEYNE